MAETSKPDPRRGGCQCGRVRYRLVGAPLGLAVCHCRDCQTQSGSAFGMSLAVRPDDFELLSGELRAFTVRCDSGRQKECSFCPACGSRIHHRIGEGLSVKAGTLDETTGLEPDAHYWTARKQPWVTIPDGVPCFEDDD